MLKIIRGEYIEKIGLISFLNFGKEISRKDLEDGSMLRLSENKNISEGNTYYSLNLLESGQKASYYFHIDKLELAQETYEKINSVKKYMTLPHQRRFRNIN